jgi:hypothetical protein
MNRATYLNGQNREELEENLERVCKYSKLEAGPTQAWVSFMTPSLPKRHINGTFCLTAIEVLLSGFFDSDVVGVRIYCGNLERQLLSQLHRPLRLHENG